MSENLLDITAAEETFLRTCCVLVLETNIVRRHRQKYLTLIKNVVHYSHGE
jgi:hypothetical protein